MLTSFLLKIFPGLLYWRSGSCSCWQVLSATWRLKSPLLWRLEWLGIDWFSHWLWGIPQISWGGCMCKNNWYFTRSSDCKYLETLSLDSEYIHNKGVMAVAQGCRLLKVLKIQCRNVTDEALTAMATSCLSLELLALYSFQQFTDKLLTCTLLSCFV